MIHMGGDIPLGYDDATLDAIQASGGGVAGDLDTALERLALGLSRHMDGDDSDIPTRSDYLDGYLWSVLPTTQVEDIDNLVIHSSEDGFNALAARQLILAESRLAQGEINDLARLDELHALAQEYGIITPYSSMIVLVNLRQEFLLGQLSGAEDRFQREQEALKDTIPATQTPLTGVPEPEEWLLIGLALALLIWYAYRQRYAIQRS
jgi:putative PEP-CTERM system integral membrane protein